MVHEATRPRSKTHPHDATIPPELAPWLDDRHSDSHQTLRNACHCCALDQSAKLAKIEMTCQTDISDDELRSQRLQAVLEPSKRDGLLIVGDPSIKNARHVLTWVQVGEGK